MPRPVEGTSPYLPGLDGIRAVAVLSVVAFHLNLGWAPGGLLGVQIFFVLSGYLITDLLIAEYHRHQGIGLRMFWIRRARRLLPALFLMLFVTVGWATLFDRSQLTALRSDLPAGIFYVSNWWFIFHHVSYFASFGPPSPLGHLWSLSIEEQFYFIWPLLLLVGMRYIHSKRVMILVTLTVAAASAAEMTILFVPGGNPTRVYDGTDTRAFALLIGAALAMALPRYQAFAPVTAGARRLLDVVGGASLVGIVAMIVATNEYETFLYRGGMLLLALLAALLIGVTIHPASHLRAVLGWEPLRWVGERSYGIYLWHYPVIVLTTPLGASPNILRAAAQIAATFGLAILSWNYVEQPVRHGALGRQWEAVEGSRLVVAPLEARRMAVCRCRRRQRRLLLPRTLRGDLGVRRRPGFADQKYCQGAAPGGDPTRGPGHLHPAPTGRTGRDGNRRFDHGRCGSLPPAVASRDRPRRTDRTAALPGAEPGCPAQGRGCRGGTV